VATAGHDRNLYLSARNIPGVCVSPVSELNAHKILAPRRLLVTRAALDAVKEQVQKNRREPTATA
jgi:large subunit ribosomal protein L4